jgi:pimeloyl-ACP methyl ester carboxylesterase
MVAIEHRLITGDGIRIHLAEAGQGPLVLLVHGFPESWYSWRHQLEALAQAGYHAVAIDVRGYGRSSKPSGIDEYRMLRHVADNVSVLSALEADDAVVVGHDWGAPIAWSSCLVRPDLFKGLVLMSVPYSPRGTTPPLEGFRRLAGPEEFYIEYFQQPGRAEAEIEPDVRSWIRGFYYTASGDAPPPADGRSMATVSPGGTLRERLVVPETLPGWMSEADFEFYASEFERTGLTGGLNRYRNMQRDWEDMAAFSGAPIGCPSLFIGGERDGPTVWGAGSIARFPDTLPGLRGCHILAGCGHWVQQERPGEVNELLVSFLAGL